MMKFGVQLYSVRDRLDGDFKGTLWALRDMGFEGVEFAGNYGSMDPGALASFLKQRGLVCCGMHIGLDQLQDAGSAAYRYAAAMLLPWVAA